MTIGIEPRRASAPNPAPSWATPTGTGSTWRFRHVAPVVAFIAILTPVAIISANSDETVVATSADAIAEQEPVTSQPGASGSSPDPESSPAAEPSAPPEPTAEPVSFPPTDPGSGTLGGWEDKERTVSPDTHFRQARRSGVWEFGDSIARVSSADLADRLLAGDGSAQGRPVPMAVDNWSSRPTGPTVDALLARVETAGGWPRGVLVAAGSNDIFATEAFPAHVERLMNAAPRSTAVLWVNVSVRRAELPEDVQRADQTNSATINAMLADAASRYPNLTVLTWSELVDAAPEPLLADGVHTTAAGLAARNSLLAEAVRDRVDLATG